MPLIGHRDTRVSPDAGFQIDSDSQCQAYSSASHEYELSLDSDEADSEYVADYHYDDDYEFPAALNESNPDLPYSIFDPFLRDGYQEDDDEDWSPDIEYVEDDVYLNDENCYEDIKGVVNLTTEFCKTFLSDAGPLYLNMFSTLDHTSYCLAHVWTFRRLEVLGLADTPTDGAPGLSGQKRFPNSFPVLKVAY